MSVERAKEFLVDAIDDDEHAAKVYTAYLQALVGVARDLGHDITVEDLETALAQMSGLDDAELAEVSGYRSPLHLDSLTLLRPVASRGFGVISNPLGFGFGLPPTSRPL